MTRIVTRRVQQTKTCVTIGPADELGLDDGDGEMNWYTLCDRHDTCIGHRTRQLAYYHAPVPNEWCEFCAGTEDWCAVHDEPAQCCQGQHDVNVGGGS